MTPTSSLHLTNAWHGASGGVRTFYEAMLAGAERHRRSLTLIVPSDRSWCEQLGTYTRIHHVQSQRSPFFDRRYRVLMPTQYHRYSRAAIGSIIARERPSIVEISDKYVLPFLGRRLRRSRKSDRPTVIGLSSERLDDNIRAWVGDTGPLETGARAWMRHVYGRCFDAHIANSEYTAGELRRALGANVDIRIGPMGVDVDGFDPSRRSSSVRSQLKGRDEALAIVYAGRLSPEKNVLALPGMIAELLAMGIDSRLVVCGGGPLQAEFERVAAQVAPGRVRVLGHLAKPALATVLASADVFVHPNPREPFGIGPLEAMASELPVVLPRAGGVLSYATDDNSWLTDATAEGLASAVRDLHQRPTLRDIRRGRALDDVRTRSWATAVDTYFSHYDAIDADRRRGREVHHGAMEIKWENHFPKTP